MFGSKVRKLQKAGDIDGLLELFTSAKTSDRANAANAFVDLDLPPARRDECYNNRLRLLTDDVDGGVRGQAILALWNHGAPGAADVCLRALNDDDSMVRLFAATGSGRLHDGRALPRLLELMVDRDSILRQNVYLALGDIGDSSVLPAMEERLRHEHDRYAKAALRESIALLRPAG